MFTSVIYSVQLEMKRQQKLKEQGRFKYTCRDPEMSDGERLAVLVEEVGETARAILEKEDLSHDKHHSHLREELIQVAAVALSWVEGLDDRARDARDRHDSGQVSLPFTTSDLTDDLPHFTDAATFLLSRPDGNYPPSAKVYSGQDMIGEAAAPKSRPEPVPCYTCGAIDPDPCLDMHSCPMMERHPVRDWRADELCNSDARQRGAPTDALDVFCTREAGHDGTCCSGNRVWY